MIIWIIDSTSGVKLLYWANRSVINIDEDLISGLLTAFHRFSVVEFQQNLESIEMGGLKWIYQQEPEYNLMFVAADNKDIKTEILTARLYIINKIFLDKYKDLFKTRGSSWEGNFNVFTPFIDILESYNAQWDETNDINQVAEIYDILRIFQQIFIILGNLLRNRMYQKSQNRILSEIEKDFGKLMKNEKFNEQFNKQNVSFSKINWFDLEDINLIKTNKFLLLDFLKSLLVLIINAFRKVKGNEYCFKYFSEEKIFLYLYQNMNLIKDLNLDLFFLKNFLLL